MKPWEVQYDQFGRPINSSSDGLLSLEETIARKRGTLPMINQYDQYQVGGGLGGELGMLDFAYQTLNPVLAWERFTEASQPQVTNNLMGGVDVGIKDKYGAALEASAMMGLGLDWGDIGRLGYNTGRPLVGKMAGLVDEMAAASPKSPMASQSVPGFEPMGAPAERVGPQTELEVLEEAYKRVDALFDRRAVPRGGDPANSIASDMRGVIGDVRPGGMTEIDGRITQGPDSISRGPVWPEKIKIAPVTNNEAEIYGIKGVGETSILKNPSQSDLNRWAGRDIRSVRSMVTKEGDLYVWPADEAVHKQVLDSLNLSNKDLAMEFSDVTRKPSEVIDLVADSKRGSERWWVDYDDPNYDPHEEIYVKVLDGEPIAQSPDMPSKQWYRGGRDVVKKDGVTFFVDSEDTARNWAGRDELSKVHAANLSTKKTYDFDADPLNLQDKYKMAGPGEAGWSMDGPVSDLKKNGYDSYTWTEYAQGLPDEKNIAVFDNAAIKPAQSAPGLLGNAPNTIGKGERGAIGVKPSSIGLLEKAQAAGSKGERKIGGANSAKSYVGAPDWVKGPKSLQQSDDEYYRYITEGAPAKDFYQDMSENNLSLANTVADADSLSGGTAVTSASTGLSSNYGHAIKGHNQIMAGDPVQTGIFPNPMGKKIERVYSGDLPVENTGPKTGPFGAHGAPGLDHSRAVHDIWDGRARGFKNPDGSQWDKGFTPQQHAFMDRQDARIIDRLNKDKVGGHDQWTREQAQAAAWAAKRVEAGEITPEELYSKYSQFNDARTAYGNYESAPGMTSDHLPGFKGLPDDVKIDYHARQGDILTDDRGRDKISSGYGLLTRPTVDNLGYFEGDFNVGSQARYLVGQGKGVKSVDESSRALADATESTRGLLTVQDASTWGKIVPAPSMKASNAAAFNLGRKPSETEVKAFEAYIKGKYGDAFFVVPDNQGIKIYPDKYEKGEKFWASDRAEKWASELKKDKSKDAIFGDSEYTMELGAHDGGYISNDWRKSRHGDDYLQAIKDTERPRIIESFDSIAPEISERLYALDQQFAKESGLPVGQAVQDMRKALASEGIAGLDKLIRTGKLSAAMAALVVPYLSSEAPEEKSRGLLTH